MAGSKGGGTTGLTFIRRIETAQIQLRHAIKQAEDQVAFRQCALRAVQLLTVVLGLPGTIRFATGIAHLRAPSLWVKQEWNTGKGIIACHLTHGNYTSTSQTDRFVDILL